MTREGNYNREGSGVGRVQKAILEAMRQNGGIWPQQWRINHQHRQALEALVRRGIIAHADGVYRMREDQPR